MAIGPEDLGKLVLVSGPEAGGGRILFTVTRISLENDRYESSVWACDGGCRAVLPGPFDVSAKPSPDGSRIALLSRRGFGEKEKGVGLWVAEWGGEPRLLAKFLGVLDYAWAPSGEALAVVAYEGSPEADVKHAERLPLWINDFGFAYNVSSHLYLVDAYSGVVEKLTEGDVRVLKAAFSPDGRRVAYAVARDWLRPYLQDVVVLDLKSGERATWASGYTSVTEIAWHPNGRGLAFTGHLRPRGFSSHSRVWVVEEGGEPRCLTCSFKYGVGNGVNSDARGPSYTRSLYWDGGSVLFQATVGGSVGVYRASLSGEVEAVLAPRGVVDEFVPVGRDILYTYMEADKPKELYLWDGSEAKKLTRFNDFVLERWRLKRPQRFVMKASDGAEVEGWVLLPEGAGPHKWVLYIHGGPKTAYGEGFMFEFHLLASRGYAVVFSNPRGSDGYDEEFADIRCRYGERDFQDLMEVADYAVRNFPLDPQKAAVAGGSYGGFMTNWIITRVDKFKAAVTQRSICDWVSMYGTTDIGWYFVEDQLCCTPWRDRERCIEKSPLYYADRVKTPTLIIHSMEDYRTWLDQGVLFFTALRLHGVEARLAIFPEESHELTRKGKPRHRVENFKEILSWLDKHV
ncbi:MAG: S9 family peptidase [Pyrobaculum arsenaticum]|uniref:Peptidase S9, prolyl oligopeptidase active site domain protein n=3 Tax=Pyrobaculum TaxID=2276 RepID=A4WIV1_PYRAR|nr:S9 family peptidase [Pyrobaculum arsenaticum]ABP50318.1 peptidase S9, prolyl oligopeptidase active site domain protein [Pyrobaculum arsenaticum DSM 13514]MCY0890301.1 S9 family peptidase [Pyrobaculum arsenaticum]NYR14741.1 S9 family peptidase [Pyrobaculum arsenaticum]